mmetsp:Transcript_6744/g.6003  ORF Transcript_6744/g.6003 Transcript_6744/m.6003 type:complete len:89 (-) Transcript_6744:512-778(-)|eukprot:CAMPEP_0170560916 /NCGR_PEP_ID=MMETSP0211-20121228/51740_1 /TAXON_ID=311385 /ORGANISM="Pseudokeronopsis sp., Strain OXSARD2" /LENGTH=88 /DNA_ID=CAMNT_0010875763 /DNA_START=427 /DNA_END=693 /DNA_ORIENTATION=+
MREVRNASQNFRTASSQKDSGMVDYLRLNDYLNIYSQKLSRLSNRGTQDIRLDYNQYEKVVQEVEGSALHPMAYYPELVAYKSANKQE